MNNDSFIYIYFITITLLFRFTQNRVGNIITFT